MSYTNSKDVFIKGHIRDNSGEQYFEKAFDCLKDLENWCFDSMHQPYKMKSGTQNMTFPSGEYSVNCAILRLDMNKSIYINFVRSESGIIFSDGTFTDSQKFIHSNFTKFSKECENRRNEPEFDFAPDNKKEQSGKAVPAEKQPEKMEQSLSNAGFSQEAISFLVLAYKNFLSNKNKDSNEKQKIQKQHR